MLWIMYSEINLIISDYIDQYSWETPPPFKKLADSCGTYLQPDELGHISNI